MGWIIIAVVLLLLAISGFNLIQEGMNIAGSDNKLNATENAIDNALDKSKEDITLPIWLIITLLAGIYLMR